MNHTMKALVKQSRSAGLTLMQRDIPVIGPDDVLIKVRATSICGTDLHIYNWDTWSQGRVKTVPLIQGHEICGDIVELGRNVTGNTIPKRLKVLVQTGRRYGLDGVFIAQQPNELQNPVRFVLEISWRIQEPLRITSKMRKRRE